MPKVIRAPIYVPPVGPYAEKPNSARAPALGKLSSQIVGVVSIAETSANAVVQKHVECVSSELPSSSTGEASVGPKKFLWQIEKEVKEKLQASFSNSKEMHFIFGNDLKSKPIDMRFHNRWPLLTCPSQILREGAEEKDFIRFISQYMHYSLVHLVEHIRLQKISMIEIREYQQLLIETLRKFSNEANYDSLLCNRFSERARNIRKNTTIMAVIDKNPEYLPFKTFFQEVYRELNYGQKVDSFQEFLNTLITDWTVSVKEKWSIPALPTNADLSPQAYYDVFHSNFEKVRSKLHDDYFFHMKFAFKSFSELQNVIVKNWNTVLLQYHQFGMSILQIDLTEPHHIEICLESLRSLQINNSRRETRFLKNIEIQRDSYRYFSQFPENKEYFKKMFRFHDMFFQGWINRLTYVHDTVYSKTLMRLAI